jgi:hydroxymethylglutaryl-CoA synthase
LGPNFEFNQKSNKILQKHYGNEWKDKCERSLYLAKMLGNIYTGSLYNGLFTLLCDKSIDLSKKKILMFSYGSGCAASMFLVKVKQGY